MEKIKAYQSGLPGSGKIKSTKHSRRKRKNLREEERYLRSVEREQHLCAWFSSF